MEFTMDYLENSMDYLLNAIELYKIADEYGNHREETSILRNKVKWKLALISLVQAYELLLKYGLTLINPILVYENIDDINRTKTVNLNTSIKRLGNFDKLCLSVDDIEFIKNCVKIRNNFIHGTVNIKTEDIKPKFSKLYCLYKKSYLFYSGENLTFVYDAHASVDIEIELFNESLTIYRGTEVKKDDLEEYISYMDHYSKIDHFVDVNGNFVKRIAFGREIDALKSIYDEDQLTIYKFAYCDDCSAKQGEYHMPDCDLEICPVCHNQKLSCNCEIGLPFEEIL